MSATVIAWSGAYGLPRRTQPKTEEQRTADIKRALAIRGDRKALRGSPGESYLRSRGLRPDPLLYPGGWPPSVGWSDDAVRRPTPPVKPAIVIDVCDPATGEITGIHRIFFRRDGTVEKNSDGRKSKFCLGAVWGSAAMLDCPPDPEGRWGIAEGVETAMACRQLYRIPVWGAIFGGNMAAITPPPWARTITIFADYDPVGREGYRPGHKFAGDALHEYRRVVGHANVRVLRPQIEGTDFADVLKDSPYAG